MQCWQLNCVGNCKTFFDSNSRDVIIKTYDVHFSVILFFAAGQLKLSVYVNYGLLTVHGEREVNIGVGGALFFHFGIVKIFQSWNPETFFLLF